MFAEGVKNGIPEFEVGAQGFSQLWNVDRVPGIDGAGDLVDVVSDAPEMTENLTERPVVGGRAALGAGSGVSVKADGTHEGGNG